MRNFEITSASNQEIPLSNFNGDLFIKEILNKNISIKNYSKELTTIFVIYQAFEPNNQYRKVEDYTRFRRKSKILELYLTLDYYCFLKANENQASELLAGTYLKGIEKYLIIRKDFDGQRFYNDVKQVFQENGILKQDRLQLV